MQEPDYNHLKLQNQICFPFYALSRLIIREYHPHLLPLGITYPQYLVLMVLWESDQQTVNFISDKLVLNTNTITPLLKRMEQMGLISRQRSDSDERKVMVRLTPPGIELRERASVIPMLLADGLQNTPTTIEKLVEIRDHIQVLVEYLKKKDTHLSVR